MMVGGIKAARSCEEGVSDEIPIKIMTRCEAEIVGGPLGEVLVYEFEGGRAGIRDVQVSGRYSPADGEISVEKFEGRKGYGPEIIRKRKGNSPLRIIY